MNDPENSLISPNEARELMKIPVLDNDPEVPVFILEDPVQIPLSIRVALRIAEGLGYATILLGVITLWLPNRHDTLGRVDLVLGGAFVLIVRAYRNRLRAK